MDFAGQITDYGIHRGDSPYFSLAPTNLVATVISASYTDAGAASNPSDYYYAVAGISPADYTVGLSGYVGKINFSLPAGYSTVSYNFNMGYGTVQTFAKAVPSCTTVWRITPGSGAYVRITYLSGTSWIGDEPIVADRAYVLYLKASATWTQLGMIFPDPNFGLVTGDNLITLPPEQWSKGTNTAQKLGQAIPGCTGVLQMKAGSGTWEWLVAKQPSGYWTIYKNTVLPGRSYLVRVTAPSVWPDPTKPPTAKVAAFPTAVPEDGLSLVPDPPPPPLPLESFAATDAETPLKFSLNGYPNPFNAMTTIAYDLPKSSEVKLTVFNILGQQVAMLVSGYQEAGHYEVVWDGKGLASGAYIALLEAGGIARIQKLALLK